MFWLFYSQPEKKVCPRPHCALHIPFSKNTYCIKLYLEFDCLGCFSPIFASQTEKLFSMPMISSTITIHNQPLKFCSAYESVTPQDHECKTTIKYSMQKHYLPINDRVIIKPKMRHIFHDLWCWLQSYFPYSNVLICLLELAVDAYMLVARGKCVYSII